MNKLIALLLLSAGAAQAALVGYFRLEEGFIDPTTNTTYCAVSTNIGTLNPANGALAWVTNGLGPVPPPGTKAALQFTAVSPSGSAGSPHVMTTLLTQDGTGSGLAGNRPKTIAAWIKPAAAQNDANATIVQMGAASPNGARVTFKLIAGSGGFVTRVEVQGGGRNGTKNVADGNWHHVALVVPTNATVANLVLYVDGVQEAISSSSGPTVALNVYTNYAAVIGATTGSGLAGDRGFTGLIDEVRIYNEALTTTDILNLYLGPGSAPSINALTDKFLVLGSTNSAITFNAGAVGTPPMNIQWKFNGAILAGQTNDALSLSPATVTNAGIYTVAVTNAYGGTSKAAVLALNSAPIVPPRQAVLAGQPAGFSVSMPADSTGYTYQWRTNGVSIPGATSSALAIGSASSANVGTNYQVIVTLGGSSATSSPAARLSVLPVPASPYAQFVLGDVPAGYWRLGETNGAVVAVDQTGYYPGVYSNYTGIELGYAGALTNDTDTASHFGGANDVQVPYDAQLTSSNGLTLETWVNPASIGAKQSLISCYGNLPVFGYELFISAAGQPIFRTYSSTSPAAPTVNDLTNNVTLVAGVWAHIVATYDGATKRLYVNGVLNGTQTVAYFPAKDVNVRFGAGIGGVGAIENPLTGELDEAAIYSKTLSAQQVQNHFLVGSIGLGVAPAITTQPANQRVILGDTNATAAFSATAFGSPRLNFQWKLGANNLTGQTNSTLIRSPVTSADIGTYSVGVTNAAAGVVSSNATLSYTTGPIAPGAQAVILGAPVTFTLTGMPAYPAYTYQWKHAGTNLPGATGPSLTLPAATVADAGTYNVLVTLGATSVESDPAMLSVLPSPTTSYSAAVAADAPVAWWPLDDAFGSYSATNSVTSGVDEGSVFPDVVLGAEGALLGSPATAAAFTGYSQGARTGQSKIDVAASATINPAVFTVECWAQVRGGAGTYRSPVTSRNAGSGIAEGYLFYAGTDDRWQFWLGNGTTWTTFSGPAVVLNQWTHLVATYNGATVAFYVNGALVASGAAVFVPNSTYNLRIGGGATESTVGDFFFPGRVDEVAVYDKALAVGRVQTHYAAAFQPNAAPRFTQQPLSRAALAGSGFALSAQVHSTPTVSYQWQHAATNLPGATNLTLALAALTTNQSGTYQIVAAHGANNSTSAPANLQVLVGEAVSVNIQGFENVRSIAANGGRAGYVAVPNWNELGYGLSAGTVTNLVNNIGQTNTMTVAWVAFNNRRWNGPFQSYAGDEALLNGFLEAAVGTNITLTVSGIPTNYQSAGYSLYLYLGEPSATVGMVTAGDTFGAVTVGTITNYYHAIDLANWDGNYYAATTTDPFSGTTSDANCAVFTNLNSAAVTVTVAAHPYQAGPASLSGFQLVADVAPATPVPLAIAQANGTISLTWPGTWVLQKKSLLDGNPNAWTDVGGAASPYSVPTPLSSQQFYRLRSP